jgi:hypothetical protein
MQEVDRNDSRGLGGEELLPRRPDRRGAGSMSAARRISIDGGLRDGRAEPGQLTVDPR